MKNLTTFSFDVRPKSYVLSLLCEYFLVALAVFVFCVLLYWKCKCEWPTCYCTIDKFTDKCLNIITCPCKTDEEQPPLPPPYQTETLDLEEDHDSGVFVNDSSVFVNETEQDDEEGPPPPYQLRESYQVREFRTERSLAELNTILFPTYTEMEIPSQPYNCFSGPGMWPQ